MKVTLETDGGFAAIPGLRRAVTVDGAALAPDQARRLDALVAAAHEAHATHGSRGVGAARDARSYTLTVDGTNGAPRTLTFSDAAPDPALGALRDFVQEHGSR